MTSSPRRVAVLGGNRIPFARSNSAYAHASCHDMLTTALDGLIERFSLQGERLGEVVGRRRAQTLARPRPDARVRARARASRRRRPPMTSSRPAATGLEAVILVANKIALGQIDVGIAGGVDTTSDAPIARQRRPAPDPARRQPRALEHRAAAAAGAASPRPDRAERPRATPSRARACRWASTARSWPRNGASRAPSRTSSPPLSHQHMAAAYERGFQDGPRQRPTSASSRDQNLRPDSSVEKLAKLKPVFGGRDGTMTAGNSTPLSDGASAVLLASEEWAAERTTSRSSPSSPRPRPRPSTTCTSARAC